MNTAILHQLSSGMRRAACFLAVAFGLGLGTEATSQTATRTLPASYTAGEPVAVVIAVNPGLPDWTVVEIIPPGWSVDIQDDGEIPAGTFDAQSSVIRWTVESPDAATLSYLTTPPPSATGPALFRGALNTTLSTRIGGRDSILPTPDPEAPTAPEDLPPPIDPLRPPVISQPPQTQLVAVGEPVTFSVTARNASAYQWQRDKINLPDEIGPSLSIAETSLEDTGNYRVIVSNPFTSVTSPTATLIVTDEPVGLIDPTKPPSIIQDPQNKKVPLGESATFFVTAENAASYQWQRNNIDIPEATGPAYSIRGVALTDGGSYHVIVSNVFGSVVSRGAILQISPPAKPSEFPLIVEAPQSKTVSPGAPVTFSVVAQNATAYQWQRNKKDIPGANQPNFKITRTTENDQGSYRVLVSNHALTLTSVSATLHVISLVEPEPGETFVLSSEDYPELPRIFSLSGNYQYSFELGNQSASVEYTLTHCGRGRLTGSGTLTVPGLSPEAYDLNVYGTIRRLGTSQESIYPVNLSLWATGLIPPIAQIVAEEESLNSSPPSEGPAETGEPLQIVIDHRLEVDSDVAQLIGTLTLRRLEPERLGSPASQPLSINLPSERDGSWTLTIQPDRIGGGTATLDLQGDRLTYKMLIRQPPESSRTIYNLYSLSASNGNLRLDLDDSQNLLLMMGMMKGQSVTVRNLPQQLPNR